MSYGSNGTEVTAVPDKGYHFVSWSDGVITATRKDVNVTGNINVTANFAINEYTLSYIAGANGSVTGTTSQTVSYGSNGTEVTAVPDKGYHFVSWSDGVTTPARTDANITGNISVTANFAINEYTLSYIAGANGSVTGTTSQTVSYGSNGTEVTAVPDKGYHFVGWSDGVTTATRKDINITGNINVTANFKINSYIVTFKDFNGEIIGVSQVVNYGGKAIAPSSPIRIGYIFKGWDKSFDYVTEDLIVTAIYESGNTYTFSFDTGSPNEVKIEIDYLKSGDNTMIISNDVVVLSIPASAIDISGLTERGYIKILKTITNNGFKNFPGGMRAVSKGINLSIQLFDNNNLIKGIHQFANNQKVKLTIKLNPNDMKGIDTSKLVILYYNEDNEQWEEMDGRFDDATMSYILYTSHFSTFVVAQRISTENVLPQTGTMYNFSWAVYFGGTLLVLGSILLLSNNKRKVHGKNTI